MPSGRSSGGHFGGGMSHSSSHSGGHFGGARSSVGSRTYRPTMRWRPHTMIFLGRPVYLSSARSGAISILGVLIVLSVIVCLLVGMGWMNYNEDLTAIQSDYKYYTQLAWDAAADETYQVWADVDSVEPYNNSGKYCIYYHFTTATGSTIYGYSFYVYDYAMARDLRDNGVLLALDTPNNNIVSTTDSIPLDYKDTTLDDDAEYLDYLATRNGLRTGTFVLIGVTVVLILAAVLVPLTAQKATKEQLAENNTTNASSPANNQTATGTGTWRCAYCNTLNDSSKNACDGCGAKRQK